MGARKISLKKSGFSIPPPGQAAEYSASAEGKRRRKKSSPRPQSQSPGQSTASNMAGLTRPPETTGKPYDSK